MLDLVELGGRERTDREMVSDAWQIKTPIKEFAFLSCKKLVDDTLFPFVTFMLEISVFIVVNSRRILHYP